MSRRVVATRHGESCYRSTGDLWLAVHVVPVLTPLAAFASLAAMILHWSFAQCCLSRNALRGRPVPLSGSVLV